MNDMNLKVRLTLMNFLEFAVWGAYLTSMGTYLVNIGMASAIGLFYAMQGIVSPCIVVAGLIRARTYGNSGRQMDTSPATSGTLPFGVGCFHDFSIILLYEGW